jgi:hypothetical protein
LKAQEEARQIQEAEQVFVKMKRIDFEGSKGRTDARPSNKDSDRFKTRREEAKQIQEARKMKKPGFESARKLLSGSKAS